ncbi:MAG: YXWGXW repeat-containing protein [Terracidiphilus sp.]
MRLIRTARWLLLALLVSLIPATSSHAAVFISVGFAPPPMPVYEQPLCPEPGLMWTPGYWGYGPDGYYWVPGAWVPAPYEGALWTPGYWGWGSGLYAWHPGYWGSQVGYYGGINYGFGYFGIGFVGGRWDNGGFYYNTAVMRVNRNYIHRVYDNRSDINRYTVARGSHVAYSGGRGGINHAPTSEERSAMNGRHMGRTSFQTQHAETAMHDRNAYAKVNGGHPHNVVASRPLGRESRPMNQARPTNQSRPTSRARSTNQARPSENRGGENPLYESHEGRTATAPHENRATPQARENRAAPQERSAPRSHAEARPEHEEHKK